MLEILFLILLLILNGLFAMSEIAIISARRSHLQDRAAKGNTGAEAALSLAEDPNRFLSTVQIGITLVSILLGALGSATVAETLASLFTHFPPLAIYSESISLIIVVLAITYLSLVIGELVPKRIALLRAENIAITFSPFMEHLSHGAAPIVLLLSRSTDLVVALLGIHEETTPSISEDEVKLMIDEGAEVGIFAPVEKKLVHQVFLLGDQTLQDLVVPRTEIVWLDLDGPASKSQQQIAQSRHTRFPVARGSLDNVVGFVLAKDLLIQSIQDEPLNIEKVMYPPLFVPASMPALDVVAYFQENHTQIVLVVGEYGELQGLVTLNDVVEAMVGDLPETRAEVDPEVVTRADGSLLVDGLLPIHALKTLLQAEVLPGEQEHEFRTLGGFVMATLERVPRTGDIFEFETECNAFSFEVVDMDGHRVDKVLIQSTGEPPI